MSKIRSNVISVKFTHISERFTILHSASRTHLWRLLYLRIRVVPQEQRQPEIGILTFVSGF